MVSLKSLINVHVLIFILIIVYIVSRNFRFPRIRSGVQKKVSNEKSGEDNYIYELRVGFHILALDKELNVGGSSLVKVIYKMYRLGNQGRALQQRLQQQPYSSTHEFQTPFSQSQNDVNMLISILKQPGKLNSIQLLSYLVHYLPRVKNEDNLRLIMDIVLQNDVIFPQFGGVLDESYIVIEAIKTTFDSKIRISEPTLSLPKFYHGIVTAIFESSVDSWRKILIITGILLSQPTYHEHSVPETRKYFINTYQSLTSLNHELILRVLRNVSINSVEINALMTVSLACSLPFFTSKQKQHLPHESITLFTIYLIFQSPFGLGHETEFLAVSKSPVVKHLSRLSFLIENSLIHGVSFGVLDSTLNIMLSFSEELHLRAIDSAQSWDVLKNIIFAVVIIFQGIASYSLRLRNGLKRHEYPIVSIKVLKILFYLNFIMEKIGTGGFQAYNFVYITFLDALLQYSHENAERLGEFFTKTIKLTSIDHYEVSKTIFTLTYFETLCQKTSVQYYESTISPVVDFIIHTTTHSRSLIEAAHSVIIATFIPQNSHIIASFAIPYLHTVLSQFPVLLSPTQLKIAIETIARSVAPPSEAYFLNKDNLRELLHTLYISCLNTRPSIPIPSQPSIQGVDDSATQGQPKTIRTGMISALISTLPYLPIAILQTWLDNIWELINMSDPIEFQFCQGVLWGMISEGFDMQRGNIGINWWYNRGSAIESKL